MVLKILALLFLGNGPALRVALLGLLGAIHVELLLSSCASPELGHTVLR